MRGQLSSRVFSKAFYGVDLAAGWLSGCPCPSCERRNNPVRSAKHGVDAIRECRNCHLYYRPTAIARGWLAKLYYGSLYTGAGLATDFTGNASPEARQAAISLEGKDRRGLVQFALHRLERQARSICVFGCSWGYEIMVLQALGLPVYGIELSDSRRQLAVEKYGLEVYESIEAAADRHPDPMVLSSHVLEHIPDIRAVLDRIGLVLRPVGQVHVTPSVQLDEESLQSVIGREHVLGVTENFWRKYASDTASSVEITHGGEVEGSVYGESIALVTPRYVTA